MLFVNDYFYSTGGSSISNQNIAHNLSEKGIETSLITCSLDRDHRFAISRTYTLPKLVSAGTVHLGMPLVHRLENILSEIKPDIIHLQVPSLVSFTTRLLARRKNVPVVIGIHDLPMNIAVFSPMFRNTISNIARWLLTKWYSSADVLISPSHYGKQYYRELGLSRKIQVISNGVDSRTFRYQIDKAEKFKNKYVSGYEDSKPLLLYVGRISPEKNLEVLMAAMNKLDAVLLVVGKPSSAKYLHELKESVKNCKVLFIGEIPLNDLVGAYSACDVLIQPSTNELQSLVILEALSCGLPVVGARYAAIPELVVNGCNGFLFEPFDENDLVGKVNLLVNQSRSIRESMSRQTLAIAEGHHLEQSAEAYIDLYSSIAR